MKDKNQINLRNTLDDLFECLDYMQQFYYLTLLFDNIEDLRNYLSKDYALTVDLYNLGVDRYNRKLDGQKEKKDE